MAVAEAVLNLKRTSLRKVRMKLTNGAGGALDLSEATGDPRFQVYAVGALDLKIDSAGTVIDEAGGEVEYTPVPSDVDTEGTYWGVWRVPFAGGDVVMPENGYIRVVIQRDSP